MKQWGWMSFVTDIAKTKQFDIDGSGMNSIDCVLEAPLYDILIYASAEKEKAEAEFLDFELEQEKRKNK